MDDLMDMIAGDESPSQISDAIKSILFAKSAEKIDAVRPEVAASLFDETDPNEDDYEDEEYNENDEEADYDYEDEEES